MTVKDKIWFYYNGHYSYEYGLINVSVSSGLYEEPFIATKEILEEEVKGHDAPFFMGIKREPLSLSLNFSFTEIWDEDLIRKVARWLNPSYYSELYFSDDINTIYYCMPEDDFQIIHNGLQQGYLTLTMRNIDCYKYSPVYNTTYDLSANTSTGTIIQIDNLGDVDYKPYLEIEMLEAGNFSIVNLSNSNEELAFTGLSLNEIVKVYNEEEIIESNISGVYRANDHNGVYLSLPYGRNTLKVTGKCNLLIKSQYKIL